MNSSYLMAWSIATRAPDTHPFVVALEVAGITDDTKSFLTALLHDSVEDGYASAKEIREHFPPEIYESVITLTRRKGEPYKAYLRRVKEGSEIARVVKIADASVNLRRCVEAKNWSLARRYEHVLDELGATREIII